MPVWLGVDVGAERKGFDVAAVDERSLVLLCGGLAVGGVLGLVDERSPVLVAVDSPRSCAPAGHTSRADEREVRRRVCGIRWTPDLTEVGRGDYYAWARPAEPAGAAMGWRHSGSYACRHAPTRTSAMPSPRR
jgi:hypothetical protein